MSDKNTKSDTALTSKQAILQSIIENTEVHLAYLDTEFNFIEVNSAYARGSGFGKDELIGKNHFDLFPNATNQKIFETVRDSGQSVEFHDKPFKYANDPQRGTTYWDWTLNPVLNDQKKVVALLLSLQEVTSEYLQKLENKKSVSRLLFMTLVSIFIAETRHISGYENHI